MSQPEIVPATTGITKKETPEEIEARSIAENLHDERAIRVLNAELTVLQNTKGGQEGYNHAAEVAETLVAIMGGIQKHMDNKLVIVKEMMRVAFNEAIANKSSPREALILMANQGVAGLALLFDNLDWCNEQTGHFQTVIDEQESEGVVKKGVKLAKGIVAAPVKISLWGASKIVEIGSFGFIKLRSGKEKQVK